MQTDPKKTCDVTLTGNVTLTGVSMSATAGAITATGDEKRSPVNHDATGALVGQGATVCATAAKIQTIDQ